MTARQKGFTLIEILVAMSLLALLGVLGYRGLESAARSSGQVQDMAQRWQEVTLSLDRLGSDARHAVALGGRDPEGRETPAWQLVGGRELTLTRASDDGNERRRVSWLGQDDRLELLTWSAFDAPAANQRHALLSGILSIEFSCLDRNQRWLHDWPPGNRHELPRALRVRLQFADLGTVERVFDVAAAD